MAIRAGALTGLARRTLSPHYAMAKRGGGGGPIAMRGPIDRPLAEEDELLWDDGTATPEPCLDEFPLITTGQAWAALAGGLSMFALLGVVVRLRDKPARQPYVSKEYPYDNLRVELGGEADDSLLGKIAKKLPFVSS